MTKCQGQLRNMHVHVHVVSQCDINSKENHQAHQIRCILFPKAKFCGDCILVTITYMQLQLCKAIQCKLRRNCFKNHILVCRSLMKSLFNNFILVSITTLKLLSDNMYMCIVPPYLQISTWHVLYLQVISDISISTMLKVHS